jgi:TetR/AcrR family transcriptional repressor of mexJK operon
LFLQKGHAGTTIEEITVQAGLARRTVYNNYADKDALFIEIVIEVIAFAEEFARTLREESMDEIPESSREPMLLDLGARLALRIVRPEVIALRRLLIGEARSSRALAREYFERAPGQVIDALAPRFERLAGRGTLQLTEAKRAAAQFAYLVAGETLDRAMLVGTTPPRDELIACAREGVETFLARCGTRVR